MTLQVKRLSALQRLSVSTARRSEAAPPGVCPGPWWLLLALLRAKGLWTCRGMLQLPSSKVDELAERERPPGRRSQVLSTTGALPRESNENGRGAAKSRWHWTWPHAAPPRYSVSDGCYGNRRTTAVFRGFRIPKIIRACLPRGRLPVRQNLSSSTGGRVTRFKGRNVTVAAKRRRVRGTEGDAREKLQIPHPWPKRPLLKCAVRPTKSVRGRRRCECRLLVGPVANSRIIFPLVGRFCLLSGVFFI